jgi:transposase
LVIKKQAYKPPRGYLFLVKRRKLGVVIRIPKQIAKFNLANTDLGFLTH